MERPGQPIRWHTSRPFLTAAWIGLSFFFVFCVVQGVADRDNDFLWHRQLGQRFLQGDMYSGYGEHYLPARIMIDAWSAGLPYRLDRALFCLLALGALAVTVVIWDRLAQRRHWLERRARAVAAALVLTLMAFYLLRDFQECGLQILLLFFLSAALYSVYLGRHWLCGFWLGLACVYKVTPLLFLPYLAYKRQWRAAGWSLVFFFLWCLAPALWLGWSQTIDKHREWLTCFTQNLALDDPSENGIEPPNPRNQALSLAIARYLQTHPPGHRLHLEHPLFAQFGDLEPATAKGVVKGVLLCLALVLAWRFRKPWSPDWSDSSLAQEWSVVCVLAAILSPLCWQQHLVLVLPAAFLWLRACVAQERLPSWQLVAAALAILIIIAVHRDFLGQQLFLVAMSYKAHTAAALVFIGLVLTLSKERTVARADESESVGLLRRVA